MLDWHNGKKKDYGHNDVRRQKKKQLSQQLIPCTSIYCDYDTNFVWQISALISLKIDDKLLFLCKNIVIV